MVFALCSTGEEGGGKRDFVAKDRDFEEPMRNNNFLSFDKNNHCAKCMKSKKM